MDEIDIYRLSKRFIDVHRPDAAVEAAMRASAVIEPGDMEEGSGKAILRAVKRR